MRNIAQLLPSKKPSTNARAQISNLQEGNYNNSNYICYGRQKLLSSRSGQCAKPLGRPPKLIMQSFCLFYLSLPKVISSAIVLIGVVNC